MEVVRILPRAERVEEELLGRLRGGAGAALGRDLMTVRQLEEQLLRAAGLRPIPPLGARLVLGEVAAQAARGTCFEPVAGTLGFARVFAQLYDSLRAAGLRAAELARRARRESGLTGRRVAAVAQVAAAYDEELAGRGLCDRAGARLRLAGALDQIELPRQLAGGGLVFEDVLDWTLARARWVGRLAARGVAVTVQLPDLPGRPAATSALIAVERLLDEVAPEVRVGVKAYGGPGALEWLHARLRRGDAAGRGAGLTVQRVEGAAGEARAVAAIVRTLLDGGAAPDDVVVAARGIGELEAGLLAALDEAGVPVRGAAGRAGDAPPVRVALALLELAGRLPRGELVALLQSRYVTAPEPGAALLGELLRLAGSRDDAVPGHVARLRELGRKSARPGGNPRLAAQAEAAALRLDRLLASLRLPSAAPLAVQAQALEQALAALGVGAQAQAVESMGGGEVDRAAAAALARDQAALRALGAALAELGTLAGRLGTGPVRREWFAALLAEALAEARLVPGGARGGAVQLVDVAELAGREVPHLVLAGMLDGRFPRRRDAEPLLDGGDRAALEAACGRPIFSRAAAAEPIHFALACAAARRSLAALAAAPAGGETAGEPSPFFDELCQLATEQSAAELPLTPAWAVVPRRLAHRPGQRLLRGALLLTGARGAPSAASATELFDVLGSPVLGPRLLAALGRLRPPDGRLRSEGAGTLVQSRLARHAEPFGGGVAWVTSASALDRYAACPFHFFAHHVLALPEPASEDEGLDVRESGRVLHEVAAAALAALAEAGLLPFGGGERAAEALLVAQAACERALVRIESEERTGPPALWAVERELAALSVRRLVEREVASRAPGDQVPTAFETSFGDGEVPPLYLHAPDPRSTEVIALRGRVDRVDLGPGAVTVIDYKSGRVGGRVAGGDLGRVHFQLALYAAWAAQRYGRPSADAFLQSLRDGQRTPTLESLSEQAGGVGVLLELDPARRAAARGDRPVEPAAGARDLPEAGPRNVADAAWAFLLAMRAGRFDVAPFEVEAACRFCPHSLVCRVDRNAEEARRG